MKKVYEGKCLNNHYFHDEFFSEYVGREEYYCELCGAVLELKEVEEGEFIDLEEEMDKFSSSFSKPFNIFEEDTIKKNYRELLKNIPPYFEEDRYIFERIETNRLIQHLNVNGENYEK